MNTQFQFWKSIRTGSLSSKQLRIMIAIAAVALVGIAAVAAMKLRSRQPTDDDKAVESQPADRDAQPTIKLTADKLRTAKLHIAICQERELEDVRTVPGKITYNESRHLEMKSPVAGVVKQVLVSPEQTVKKDESLAVLSSPDIGLARDDVAQCRANLMLAQKEAARTEEISRNLIELLELLKKHPEPTVIEKTFDNKALGDHRQEIVASYSKLYMAEAVAANTRALEESGGISGRLVEERHSNREVAKAAFETACEQSKFEMSQGRDKTRAAVEHADRLLAVSCQRLQALGGDCSEREPAAGSALSDLISRAPFDGVIEERLAVVGAHIAIAQPLFVLANTDTLWVSAEVHERDWRALDTSEQHELILHAPSLPGSETAAHVKFTEGKISAETHSVTIVGELDNGNKKFRPGMFVWVSVPMSQPRRALAVPTSAIVDHEQAKFVFVADSPDTFRRVDVKTGIETPEWIEITEGLKAGQQVVDQGTFILKSELLLEREAE